MTDKKFLKTWKFGKDWAGKPQVTWGIAKSEEGELSLWSRGPNWGWMEEKTIKDSPPMAALLHLVNELLDIPDERAYLECPQCGNVGIYADENGFFRDGDPVTCGCDGWFVSCDSETAPYLNWYGDK